MKRPNIFPLTILILFMMSFPLEAEPIGTEAELQTLERELNEDQTRLNQRRQALQLRKQQLELQKSGKHVPNNAEPSFTEKTKQLAQLRADAEAEKNRNVWITKRQEITDLLEADKTEKKMGSPKPVGKKAIAKEEAKKQAKAQTEAQIKGLDQNIFTSMQTTLQNKGTLNDTEIKWLESLVAVPEDKDAAPVVPVVDETTRTWAKLILEMAGNKEAESGKTPSVLGR